MTRRKLTPDQRTKVFDMLHSAGSPSAAEAVDKAKRRKSAAMPLLDALSKRMSQRSPVLDVFDWTLLRVLVGSVRNGVDARAMFFEDWQATREHVERQARQRQITANRTPLFMLKLPEVLAVTGLSKSTIQRLEHVGKFPQRVKLSEWSSAWRSDELDAWLRSRPRASSEDSES